MSPRQLRRWREAVQEHGEDHAFPGQGKARDQELMRLKQENAQRKKDLDFLKQAARYFAKESK